MPDPVIVMVVDDGRLRDRLAGDLGRRFATDYALLAGDSTWASDQLPRLASEGREVALVLAESDLPAAGTTGATLLSRVRASHPRARRLLLVERGRWSGHPVREAMMLGQVDSYVFTPWAQPEQWLYLPVTEALAEWAGSRPADPVAATVVGRSNDPHSYALRDTFTRASIPYAFLEADSPAGGQLLARLGRTGAAQPVVAMYDGTVLEAPTDRELVVALGFPSGPADRRWDLAVVGAGPSGLSTAVYAASEGLSTVVIDPTVPGGQAGTSSRIRNYLGFPRGLGGSELTTRAVEQAWLFGAEMLLAHRISALVVDGDDRVLTTEFGQITARAVVLAIGVDWRRLAVPSLDAFAGAGVYYGAAGSETEAMTDRRVVVVGGGNSAGQAAIHLARRAASVTILIRRESLSASMSDYLVQEIAATGNIVLQPYAEVVDGAGEGRLERIVVRDTRGGSTTTLLADALFVMIGAEPRTDWLDPAVARDDQGYLLTGDDVPPYAWPMTRRPAFLETSVPGVFAVGDVQHGSTKRVATAVGSGATAVRLVHEYLADPARAPAT